MGFSGIALFEPCSRSGASRFRRLSISRADLDHFGRVSVQGAQVQEIRVFAEDGVAVIAGISPDLFVRRAAESGFPDVSDAKENTTRDGHETMR